MIHSISVVAIVAIVGLVVVVALVHNRKFYVEDAKRGWMLEVGQEADHSMTDRENRSCPRGKKVVDRQRKLT